ncbi:MAG: hypothetical protein ABL904_09915 [Hyphomicrobiaceae bacterium]
MKQSFIGKAVASALSLCLIAASVGAASAQVTTKKVFVKPGAKVVVVKPGPGPRNSNRNRNIGLGVAAAVVGTAIAIEAARANSGERRYYRSGGGDGLSCPALERRCDGGQEWACRRLEVREDC